jgi:hypothetical protein
MAYEDFNGYCKCMNGYVMDKNLYILIDDCKLNNTEVKFQVIDKGFVTAKEFKKLSKQYKGIVTYTANNENDFHIKLIEP